MKVRCQNFRQGHIEAYRKIMLKGQFKMRNQFSLGEKKQNRLVFFIRYPTSKCHFDKDFPPFGLQLSPKLLEDHKP